MAALALRRRAAGTALAVISLLFAAQAAAAQSCPAGSGLTGASTCVPCTGNKVSPDGTRCIPCKTRSAADASHIKCVCATGVVDDGTGSCSACLPGFGGGLCRQCKGKAVSKGGSLKGCAPCKIRTTPNGNFTDCVCAKNVQAGGTCNACMPGYGGAACKKCAKNRYSLGTNILACKVCGKGSKGLADGTGCTCTNTAQVWDPTTNKCGAGVTCPTGTSRDADGNCICSDANQELLTDGTCAAKCASNQIRNANKACSARPAGRFNIQLVRIGTDSSQDATFAKAAAKWEAVLALDVPDFTNSLNVDLSQAWVDGYTNYQASVDDIVIMYGMSTLAGNTLGWSGPTYYRNDGSNWKHTPVAAVMMFDKDKISGLGGQKAFEYVILHEMGHAIGMGTVDDKINCVVGCTPGSNTPNYWKCKNAQAAYAAAGCSGQLPIETAMGSGSGCSHWQEATLKNELMTPVLDKQPSPAPMSAITIGGAEDIYGDGNVDYSQAQYWRCKLPGASVVSRSAYGTDAPVAAATAPASEPYVVVTLLPIAYPPSGFGPAPAGTLSASDAGSGGLNTTEPMAADPALEAELIAASRAAQRPPEWGGPPLDGPKPFAV